jgi:heavy metal sensor kinase
LFIFGLFVYELQWQSRLHQTDAELDRTAEVIVSRLRRLFPSPWPFLRPRSSVRSTDSRTQVAAKDSVTSTAGDTSEASTESTPARNSASSGSARTSNPRPQPAPGLGLPDEFLQLFEGDDESRLYFVVWSRTGEILAQSRYAPDVAFPNLHAAKDGLPHREARVRDAQREVIHVSSFNNHVLVGRSIRHDLIAQQRAAAWLVLTGLGVLAVGLLGGWWLSGRAIQPLAVMSATAQSISARNLSSRINVQETDNELGQLATVLNRTFDRLQSAFEQQSRFTADASHELRTPLAVILSHTELALSRQRTGDDYREALEACRRASQRMKALIDSLLLLARFDSHQPELQRQPVDLEQIAHDSVELIRPLAEQRRITIRMSSAPTGVFGDRDRLSQVVTNLLSNAIRYNREGGSVTVSVAANNGHGVIRVMDTGIGLSADELPHIFERFFRVDKARSRSDGGCGLGLAICQSIIEAHGGKISAASQPDEGTTIEVHLPRIE